MIQINIELQKCQLLNIPVKTLNKLREKLKIRDSKAFYSPAFKSGKWDGFHQYITDRGYFQTGYLPKVVELLKCLKLNYKLTGKLKEIDVTDDIPDDGITYRDEQVDSVKALVENQVDDLPFYRGVLSIATNGGKTLTSVLIHRVFTSVPTLYIINRKQYFDEAIIDLQKVFGDDLGYIKAGKVKWGKFMVCMVQSTANNIDKYAFKLKNYKVLIVDEVDACLGAQAQKVLGRCTEALVRVGLTGTGFKHKDKNKNERLREFFGNEIFKVSNRKLIDLGRSTEVQISIWPGNLKLSPGADSYYDGIVKSKTRNIMVANRAKIMFDKELFPQLIITHRQKHVKMLYRRIKKLLPNAKIDWLHNEKENKAQVIKDFKEGKIDILVGSYILARAKNFPLIKYLSHAGGHGNAAQALQILGRAVRFSPTKKITYMDDFYDYGDGELRKNSRIRIKAYKGEELEVLELYKETIKKLKENVHSSKRKV